jgi:hypothetical protein
MGKAIGRVKCWNLLVLVLAHADADCRQMDLGARTYELGYGLKWLACEMRTCFLFLLAYGLLSSFFLACSALPRSLPHYLSFQTPVLYQSTSAIRLPSTTPTVSHYTPPSAAQ